MNSIDLNSGWQLRYEDLSTGHEDQQFVCAQEDGWLDTSLPCDVHVPLIAAGIITEPLEGIHCFDSEWIENKSWWFRKQFTVDDLDADSIELLLDYLDWGADIYLNGKYLGCHRSVFYTFRMEVKHLLQKGDNMLTLRLSAGTERVPYDMLGNFKDAVSHERNNGRPDRGDQRRAFLRKPQYVFGWDWAPRVGSCGMGNAQLQFRNCISVESLFIRTLSVTQNGAEHSAVLSIDAEIENLHPFSTKEESYILELLAPDGTAATAVKGEVFLRAGLNTEHITVELQDPQLWWPNGYGGQPLYTARLSIGAASGQAVFGIRTLALDMSRMPERGPGFRRFAFTINSVSIFCKGANWIPADSVWQRVSEEKYRKLIQEAKDAGFTMLRVWGGGIYEKGIFYRLCDEAGILVWQDFMFGCGMYPDREEWFRDLVEKEMAYQVKRLRNHPCLSLWCGNNENHWAFDTKWYGDKLPYFGGQYLYNRLAPEIVRLYSPDTPYWNSSPYGGEHVNDNGTGDRHHWHDCMMNPDMENRITPEKYDEVESSFVSEYGYVGPSVKESIQRYFGDQDIEVGGAIWQHHNNAFEKDTVQAGIKKHYTDPENLCLDEYLLYAGLCQGLMYGYSLEAMRSKLFCGGSLFWMYNDTWGENGWTIIDYYCNRKISYYFVKRAFRPRKLILRAENGTVHVTGCNDTAEALALELEYGHVAPDGTNKSTKTQQAVIAPRSRKPLFTFHVPEGGFSDRIVFVRPAAEHADCGMLPELLREERVRRSGSVHLSTELEEESGGRRKIKVSTDSFAHAVHFALGPDFLLSDEYFDLLPGETRCVDVESVNGKPLGDIYPRSV
jgi:beta-mannosidase